MYPSLDFRNKFHQDSIFPKSHFTRKNLIKKGLEENKIESYLSNYNCLTNLQLLEGIPNQEKSDMDFKEWLFNQYPEEQGQKDHITKHYIPDVDLELDDFDEFISEMKKLMFSKLKSIL